MGQLADLGLAWAEKSKKEWRAYAANPEGASMILSNGEAIRNAEGGLIRREAEVGTILVGLGTGEQYTIAKTLNYKFRKPEQLQEIYAIAAATNPTLAVASEDLRHVPNGHEIVKGAMLELANGTPADRFKLAEAIRTNMFNRNYHSEASRVNDHEFGYNAAEIDPKTVIDTLGIIRYKGAYHEKLLGYAQHQLSLKNGNNIATEAAPASAPITPAGVADASSRVSASAAPVAASAVPTSDARASAPAPQTDRAVAVDATPIALSAQDKSEANAIHSEIMKALTGKSTAGDREAAKKAISALDGKNEFGVADINAFQGLAPEKLDKLREIADTYHKAGGGKAATVDAARSSHVTAAVPEERKTGRS